MVLLDTCTLLWLVADQDSLSKKARMMIEGAAGNLYISSISAFEIAVKFQKGKLSLPMHPAEWYQKVLALHGIDELSITGDISIHATCLPPIHKDPADRMIVATAQKHKLKIVTPDQHIRAYDKKITVW